MDSIYALEDLYSLGQYMKDRKNPNMSIRIPTIRSLLGRIDFLQRDPSILSPRRLLYYLAGVDAFLRERATALVTILAKTIVLCTSYDEIRQLSALRSSLVFLRSSLGRLHSLVTDCKQRLMQWTSVLIVVKARNSTTPDGQRDEETSSSEQGSNRRYNPFVVTCNRQLG